MRRILMLTICFFSLLCAYAQNRYEVTSPDKKTEVQIKTQNDSLEYTVMVDQLPVIKDSKLGISLKSTENHFVDHLRIVGHKVAGVSEVYTTTTGKQTVHQADANELTLTVRNRANSTMNLVFRAFNNGVAFRYELNNTGNDTVTEEITEFRLVPGSQAWIQKYACDYERFYSNRLLDTMREEAYLMPGLFKTPDNNWCLITDADVDGNYAACQLAPDGKGGLKIHLPDQKFWNDHPQPGTWEVIAANEIPLIFVSPKMQTPWRVMALGSTLAPIVESNLTEDLSKPSVLADTSWIRPGVAVFPWWGDNIANDDPGILRKYIDLAAEMNWKFMEFDIGLLQNNGGYAADYWRSIAYVPEIIQYAASKGIAVYGWDERKYLDNPEKRADIFGIYQKMGVKGIKIDFLNSDKQEAMRFRVDALADAAKYHLLVSFHGDITPRGLRRTFPNLVTAEGVRGSEYYLFAPEGGQPNPVHNCTLPFTRNVVGPMDYTPVAFSAKRRTSTYAHELALSVIVESGWLCMCDTPEMYLNSPAKAFLQQLVSVWDEIKFIDGYPGEFICLARRRGNDWYVAGISAKEAGETVLNLDFIQAGDYKTTLYSDGEDPMNELNVSELTINDKQPLHIKVAENGGFAFIIKNSKKQKAQFTPKVTIVNNTKVIHPLEQLTVVCNTDGLLSVTDGTGIEYLKCKAAPEISFKVGGSLGKHTVELKDAKNRLLATSSFNVDAETGIDDKGKIAGLFNLLHKGMLVYSPAGYEEVNWNGKTYRYFVNWVLDNNNTMMGMKYFSPYSSDLVDLFRETQEPDGRIWSFVSRSNESDYYETAYTPINCFRKDKDAFFVRQPNENHVEYNYVNMIYQHWKASGDTEWMKKNLECAARALDYCVTDSVRWSERFQLLKRPYCIDSWDFQVDDEYTPFAYISPTMVLVPGKTKFGVFFGDNTGYYEACNQLAEMLEYAGFNDRSAIYTQRGKDILDRLIKLSWNGKFFTHFIDEDPAVVRNLGVDEKSQIAQGNMYSINRGLPHEMDVEIIKTYLNLKANLPVGSPGEWYAIYPPFEKGFGKHNAKWQYMNGGVAGHGAGELARGAYENGYEEYASDILYRLLDLGQKYGDRIWFSYTGSIPLPPAKPGFRTIDLTSVANMDLWDKGGNGSFPWMNANREGNDMRGLPTGKQVFHDIAFKVIDPDHNQRKSAVAVSVMKGFPRQAEVVINDSAKTVYLLHSSSDNIPSNVAGSISFIYTDGTEASQYLMKGKEVTNWWFSSLKTDRSGVAWSGPNPVSTKVGVCWAAIDNPQPEKKIAKLLFNAPLEGGIYAVLGITLADKPHYVKPKAESFGGPDNWAAALGIAALVEGLAGVQNRGLAYSEVLLSPRWNSASVDSVNVTARFAASDGYVAYQYHNDPEHGQVELLITGSGNRMNVHLLLPEGTLKVDSVTSSGQKLPFILSKIENSQYVDFKVNLPGIQEVVVKYDFNLLL
jgi:hypothetical protein